MGKYFGTDGIRGIANRELSAELAYNVGRAASKVLREAANHRPLFFIGKDTRISSDMLEAALVTGLCSTGADVELLGVIPTPAVACLTKNCGADAGIMISASHNPFEYNGIKIFNSGGYKLNDRLEEQIESLLDSLPGGHTDILCPEGENIGRVKRNMESMSDKYIEYLGKTLEGNLSGMKIAVDCANGSASATAFRVFRLFGADADIAYCEPNGLNINDNCGSTSLDALRKRMLGGGFDVGVAFDGDADRCLVVDELGREMDGDKIMAICAMDMKSAGKLPENAIVGTVLSNLGLHSFARSNGMRVETAQVGDRFVLEKMLEGGFALGGEQSGHIIFRSMATTGDGQLTAIQFLNVLKKSGKKCSELSDMIPKFPQIMVNCAVPNTKKTAVIGDKRVAEAILEAEALLGGEGRILVRPSGTEALVRVMAEGPDGDLVARAANGVAERIDDCASGMD